MLNLTQWIDTFEGNGTPHGLLFRIDANGPPERSSISDVRLVIVWKILARLLDQSEHNDHGGLLAPVIAGQHGHLTF